MVKKFNIGNTTVLLRINDDKDGQMLFKHNVLSINEVGIKIILYLSENLEDDEIINKLTNEYSVSSSKISEDYFLFKNRLIDLGILL